MKRVRLILPALLILIAALSAHAEVRTMDPVSDPLGNCTFDQTADECMGLSSTTTTQLCSDSWGCPQCGMNNSLTDSVCFRVRGNWGYCSCSANGTYVDKWGTLQPKCNVAGSCRDR